MCFEENNADVYYNNILTHTADLRPISWNNIDKIDPNKKVRIMCVIRSYKILEIKVDLLKTIFYVINHDARNLSRF